MSLIQNPHSEPNWMALQFFPEVQVLLLLGINSLSEDTVVPQSFLICNWSLSSNCLV